ncbi:MAG TPA: hypothetical protein EYN66_07840 [Myxococcales bacterium]|nr:hypothetical protein [Myxococcales bacterium]
MEIALLAGIAGVGLLGTGVLALVVLHLVKLRLFMGQMISPVKDGDTMLPAPIVQLGISAFREINTIGHRSLSAESSADIRAQQGARKELIESYAEHNYPIAVEMLKQFMPDYAKKAARNPQILSEALRLWGQFGNKLAKPGPSTNGNPMQSHDMQRFGGG